MLFQLNSEKQELEGALGEMVANALGEGIAPGARGALRAQGQGGTSVHRRQENNREQ